MSASAFFRIGFEILFNQPQELVDLISDLERTLKNIWGGVSHISSSSLVWGGDSEMVRLAFSEQIERGGIQIQLAGLLRASGVIECLRASRCVEIYEHIYEATRSRGMRIRITISP